MGRVGDERNVCGSEFRAVVDVDVRMRANGAVRRGSGSSRCAGHLRFRFFELDRRTYRAPFLLVVAAAAGIAVFGVDGRVASGAQKVFTIAFFWQAGLWISTAR